MVFKWSPLSLDYVPESKVKMNLGKYAVLILNRPILVEPAESMTTLWKEAIYRCTTDGGTNRWLQFLRQNNLPVDNFLPDLVSGDFDSISEATMKLIKGKGIEIEETPDQSETDFMKALILVCKKLPQLDSVLVVADHSGRLDQILSNLNVLSRVTEISQSLQCFILTSDSITWHLRAGKHIICIPPAVRDERNWCSILPFAPKSSSVYTSGLKWNLDGESIEFGGLISSSNTYDVKSEDINVEIETDTPLLWSMSLGRRID